MANPAPNIKLTPVRDILAHFLGYESVSALKRGSIEASRGHRLVCLRFLAKLFGLSFFTVRKWGKGIDLTEAPRERILELNVVYLQSILSKKDARIKELESRLDYSYKKSA